MRIHRLRPLAVLALVAGALLVPAAASAAPPANDDFANATAIDPSSLPFSASVDITDATTQVGEPSPCYTTQKSIWYAVTPASDSMLRVDMVGSVMQSADPILNVYQDGGGGLGALGFVGCAASFGTVTFMAHANSTYYFQLGNISGGFGTAQINVAAIPPPANDNIANASVVSSLPFSDSQDLSSATMQAGEPSPGCFGTSNTVWYSFTPDTTQSITATTDQYGAGIAAYTGSSLPNLSQVGCTPYYFQPLTFRAQAGTTYFFQVGAWCCGGFGPVTFRLQVAPNPVAQFSYYPSDPSVFDTVQFYDQSYDPAGVGISSEAWKFGDGSAASGCCPTHRYAADGDYTVELDVTTTDGRTASTQQVVHVRTHDVTIAKVIVPQTASVGQTRSITVGLTNSRYPETVQVQLLKSVAGGGWQQVGVLTQYVPVRGANRTTNFNFSYTLAPEDATLGKVSFQAVATIQGARDAIPTDNTFISLPTKVR
jgi:PKD repeat protein